TNAPPAAADASAHAVLASLLGGEAAKTAHAGQQTADAQSAAKAVSPTHGDKANVAQAAGAASSQDTGQGGQFGEHSSSNGESKQGPKLDATGTRATAEAKSAESIDKVADAPVAPAPSAVQQVKTTVIDALAGGDTATNSAASSPSLPQDRPVATGQVLRT